MKLIDFLEAKSIKQNNKLIEIIIENIQKEVKNQLFKEFNAIIDIETYSKNGIVFISISDDLDLDNMLAKLDVKEIKKKLETNKEKNLKFILDWRKPEINDEFNDWEIQISRKELERFINYYD